VRAQSQPPRCRTVSTGLLDLCQSGRSWTQSMEGQPQGFLERVHRLWAHRCGQPLPHHIHLPKVRAPRVR
jgi:hypothetical protein